MADTKMNVREVVIDINKPVKEYICAKQNDVQSRYLLFKITDRLVAFNLTGKTVRAYGVKPDGKEIYNDLVIIDALTGACELELTTQVLAFPGDVKFELEVMEGVKKLSTIPFKLDVIPSLNNGNSIESTNEFTALVNGLNSLNEYDSYKNEIKTARGSEVNLGAKIGKIDSSLADITKPVPVISFTFDDGCEEDNLTYSILKEYGFVGTFGLITDKLYDANKNSLSNYYKYQNEGFEILSHSATHLDMKTDVSNQILRKELLDSAERLRNLGFSCNGFIAPFSGITSNNNNYAKDIYDYILVGGTGLNGKSDYKDKKITRVSQYAQGVEGSKVLIDQAITEKKLLVFYDHRIGYSGALSEADFRLILDYVKTKVNNGLIQVCNMKNAMSKYYGINLDNKSKKYSSINNSGDIQTSYVLTNNTCNAVATDEPATRDKTKRLTVPATATVGSGFEYTTTIDLPCSFKKLGERAIFKIDSISNNSQFTYFNHFLTVSLLDNSGVELSLETKQIYPYNLESLTFDIDIFNKYPVVLDNIYKIKVGYKAILNTTLTVQNMIKLSSPILKYVNI